MKHIAKRASVEESGARGLRARAAMRAAICVLSMFVLTLSSEVGLASASKEVVDYFGTEKGTGTLGGQFHSPSGIAVNSSGAGPADSGDIYVVDARNNRIQRFHRDNAGTPGDGRDDTYDFVSAWGAGVDSAVGGSGYQVCTVAAQCQAGVPSDANGALNFVSLKAATGIAVDQDTGDVYVVDAANYRVSVYTGDGTFLRSFGYDVVKSGPGKIPAPNERQQLTVKASDGKFSLFFDGKTTGAHGRVWRPDVGTKTLEQLVPIEGTFSVGQSVSGKGIAPGTTITAVEATRLKISKPTTEATTAQEPIYVNNLPSNASASEVEASLNALPSIGGVGGSVTVTGGPGDETGTSPYTIEFEGARGEDDLRPIVPVGSGLSVSSGAASATISTLADGGAYEICEASAGDLCQAGAAGDNIGELGIGDGFFEEVAQDIAISAADGNSATGEVFLADTGNGRVGVYNLDGSSPSAFGAGAFSPSMPTSVAVDSRGIVYATDVTGMGGFGNFEGEVLRYDSEDANGSGVRFLPSISSVTVAAGGGPGNGGGTSPYELIFSGLLGQKDVSALVAGNGAIPLSGGTGVAVVTSKPGGPGTDEVQQVKVSATSGQFKLTFNGETTGATGAGDLTAGSSEITNVNTATGTFVRGEEISGSGIPANTTINSVKPNTLILNREATTAGTGVSLSADLPFDAASWAVKDALEALSSTPAPSLPFGRIHDLSIDADADGGGPEGDILNALGEGPLGEGRVSQFGPVNAPGLIDPPAVADDIHGSNSKLTVGNLAIDENGGRIYVAGAAPCCGDEKEGVFVLDTPGPPPSATLDSLSDVTSHSIVAHATVNPNGPPALRYHFEYSLDGKSWVSTPGVVLGSQETPQSVEVLLDPPGGGLEPSTLYHVRLVAERPFIAPIITAELTTTTLGAAPRAETTGSPMRGATTARLDSRVDPAGTATTYYFEYGDLGPCDSNPCTATEVHDVGSGREVKLVSEQLTDLEPGTTYHYRVVADNGNSGSPVSGEDMTLTTFASDAPLSHGHLAGPPGSDRAYEQVNMPDTGGNPVFGAIGFSGDGGRAAFRIAGGTPDSSTGSLFGFFFSERTPSGWEVKQIAPERSDLVAPEWSGTVGNPDLSAIFSTNIEYTKNEAVIWRFDPSGQPSKLFEVGSSQELPLQPPIGLSSSGTRVVVPVIGSADPAYPSATAENLYDIGTGTPHLVSILPGGGISPCGVLASDAAFGVSTNQTSDTGWVSPDGSLVFFPSKGNDCGSKSQLYVRDMGAEETRLVSGPRVSGPACGAGLIRAVPGAVFFWTQSRLAAEDTEPAACGGGQNANDGDVYRFTLADGSLKCVTCVVPGLDADVRTDHGAPSGPSSQIAVAQNGSRVYFQTGTHLLPGAPKNGEAGAYRVDVDTGDLAFVGSVGSASVGQSGQSANVLSADGSVLFFRSNSPSLNALGGQQNGGTQQDYRYNDRDRSLACISCPADGSAPVSSTIGSEGAAGFAMAAASDGNTVAFVTPTPLVDADLNTAAVGQKAEVGEDVYEWRDGRLLLVTDGLSSWTKNSAPKVSGISIDGRDVFFRAAAQYTPDALDAYQRLYDARIGGGFEFPRPPKPCPLEVCQGTPKGAPEEQAPGTGPFVGPGNAAKVPASCRKGKVRRKGHCVVRKPSRKHPGKRANHDRRAHR